MTAPEHDPAVDMWEGVLTGRSLFEWAIEGFWATTTTAPDMPVRWEGDDS